MQDLSLNIKLVAFNIHPKQHNVKEEQRIVRDEGKLYTYLVPQAKRNRAFLHSQGVSPFLPEKLPPSFFFSFLK